MIGGGFVLWGNKIRQMVGARESSGSQADSTFDKWASFAMGFWIEILDSGGFGLKYQEFGEIIGE